MASGTVISTEEFLGKPTSSGAKTMSTDEFFSGSLMPGTVQQKAGEVPTKEYFKSMGRGAIKGSTLQELTPEEQDTPGMQLGEMAGSIVPMAVSEAMVPGGPLVTPMAKAGLAGMVYGASKGAVNQKPIPQQLKDISVSSLGFMGAQKLNQLVSKIFQPVNPADTVTQGAVKVAEQEGIKPLPSMISKSKAVAGTERALEYSPFGSQITNAREKAIEEFGNYANRVGESISPTKDPEVNGSLIKEASKGYYDTFNDMRKKLYDSFMPKIGDKPVDVKEIISALKGMIGTSKNRGDNGIASYAENILQKIEPTVPTSKEVPGMAYPEPTSPFAKIKDIATGLGNRTKFHDPSNPGMQGQTKRLYGIFQDTLDNTAEKFGDESIVNDLAKAKEYNHVGKSILESKTYDALINAPQGMEYKIAFNKNDPLAYEAVKEITGPELMGGMARQWFNDVLEKSTKNKIVSPQLLLNKLDKGQVLLDKLVEDFPEAVNKIGELKTVASLLSKNADVMKGSQTAAYGSLMAILGEIGASVGTMFVNPKAGLAGLATGVGALGASKAGSSFYTSDIARRLFTKGMGAFPKARPLVGKAAEIGARLGVAPLTDESQ